MSFFGILYSTMFFKRGLASYIWCSDPTNVLYNTIDLKEFEDNE